ncbi:MAG: hypothetical protein IPI22_04850, partial [Bacteroidetes bacterium]|nr:hypothetical protein [Bacteroidota bacterium]
MVDRGVGKTRWIRRLIPSQLADYFHNGAINLNDKDHMKRLASGFITFIDEIDSYNRYEMAKLKAILTQEDILYRKPYGRFEVKYPRTTSFIAATNNPEFLTDETSNRRFLPLTYKMQISTTRSIWIWYLPKFTPLLKIRYTYHISIRKKPKGYRRKQTVSKQKRT